MYSVYNELLSNVTKIFVLVILSLVSRSLIPICYNQYHLSPLETVIL